MSTSPWKRPDVGASETRSDTERGSTTRRAVPPEATTPRPPETTRPPAPLRSDRPPRLTPLPGTLPPTSPLPRTLPPPSFHPATIPPTPGLHPATIPPPSMSPATIPPPSMSPASTPPSSDRPWFERLPKPPGEGPFRIKGVAYKGLLQFVKSRVDGGMGGFMASLRDPALKSFLTQPFLAGSFYDFFPIVAASGVVAALCRFPLESFAHGQGRSQAQHDAENVHRAFLNGRAFEDLATRYRPFCARYYDFGQWDARPLDGNAIRLVARGMPAWAAPWIGAMQGGYVTGLVNLTGKPDPLITIHPSRRDGAASGLPTVTIEVDITLRG